MKRNRSTIFLTATVILLAVFFLGAIFSWFRRGMNREVEVTTDSFLTENVKALAAVFYTKLNDQMVMLESQERYFEEVDLANYNQMKETIMSTKGIGAFKTIGVASPSGATMNYNGMSSGNILLKDYFKEAMSGQNAVSEQFGIDEEGDEVLVLAVPIYQKGEVAGLVYGTFTRQELNELVNTFRFAGSGENLLLAEDGQILARTTQSRLLGEEDKNLNDLLNLPGEIPAEGLSAAFEEEGEKQILVLTPVGVHHWYFGTIIPESVISSQTAVLSRYIALAILLITLVAAFLMGYILLLMRSSSKIYSRNERLALANSQTRNIVFDYSFPQKRMSVEGDSALLVKKKKPEYTLEEIREVLSRIHEEDKAMVEELDDLMKNRATTVVGEFRLRCLNGNYYWYRCNATVLRDMEEAPIRIVGTILNVDEERHKELDLIRKAETDSLTGLMSKVPFQAHLAKLLSEAMPGQGYALFMMDLDNFKFVNDTMGHAIGDQVLVSVATRLKDHFPLPESLGRIGGDEFAAWIPLEGDDEDALLVMLKEKAKAVCKSLRLTSQEGQVQLYVSGSVGVAMFPGDAKDFETLYRKADKALYEAKNAGKSRYRIASAKSQ